MRLLLHIIHIDTLEALNALKEEWNTLLTNCKDKNIFLTHEWITTWWEYFSERRDLFILLVKENERLIGIAPLMLTLKKIEFIGTPLSDYCDFIIEKEHEEALKAIYGHLLENRKLWRSISLGEIPEKSLTLLLSPKILQGLTKYFNVSFSNPCFAVDFKGLTSDDVNAITNKKGLRRHINHFNQSGRLDFQKVNDLNDVYGALNVFFEQHIRLWAGRGMLSMFNNQRYKEFIRSIAKNILSNGNLGFWVLKFNDQIIAASFGFEFNKVYISYCQSHDLEYCKRSPGIIMQKYLIEKLFEEGSHIVDFSRGAEVYKLRFSNKSSSNFGITINKNIADYLLTRFYHSVRERIMKKNKLHSFLNKIRYKTIGIFSKSQASN